MRVLSRVVSRVVGKKGPSSKKKIGESGPNPSPSGKPPLTRQSRISEVDRRRAGQRLAGGMLESKSRFLELMLKKHVVVDVCFNQPHSSSTSLLVILLTLRYFPTFNH